MRLEGSTEPFLTGADRFLTGIDPARFGSISLLSILTGPEERLSGQNSTEIGDDSDPVLVHLNDFRKDIHKVAF